MSAVMLADVDGRRVELKQGELIWQTRCDACGEFVTRGNQVSVDWRILIQGVPGPQAMIDLHSRCVTRLDWPGIIAAAVARGVPGPLVVPK